MKKREFLSFKPEVKFLEAKADGDKYQIEAYVSIFGNVDLGGDIIQAGAFDESIAKKFPVGCWMHDWNEVIAVTLEAREDQKGLFIKAQFVEGVQRAEEVYRLIKAGAINEFSIGFRVLDYEWDESGHRVIKKVKLYEWSPVVAGMNPDTELLDVKSEMEKSVVNYVHIDENAGEIRLFCKADSKQECVIMKMSHKYKAHIKALAAQKAEEKGQKVEGEAVKKILRLAVKADKSNEEVIKQAKKILRVII